MKLLREFTNENHGFPNKEVTYRVRKAARGVLFDGDKIALLHVTKKNYHKLPGGGLDEDESIEAGLHREVQEETGCKGTVGDEIGVIIEYRDDFEIIQFSYNFMMTLDDDSIGDNFDPEEVEAGFELEWYDFDEAIKLFEKEEPTEYEARFINKRDLLILQEARKLR